MGCGVPFTVVHRPLKRESKQLGKWELNPSFYGVECLPLRLVSRNAEMWFSRGPWLYHYGSKHAFAILYCFGDRQIYSSSSFMITLTDIKGYIFPHSIIHLVCALVQGMKWVSLVHL